MKKIENYCNGCPECIGCRYGKDIEIEVCTACEEELESDVYEIDCDLFCSECAWIELENNYKDKILKEYRVN